MATYRGLAVAGQTVVGLLADACPKAEFPAARFEVYQAGNFSSHMDEGISLYLYRISINNARRNNPPRLSSNGLRHRPSLPVDLHYMLTSWARSAAQQHRLLGWAMRTLEDNPVLPASLLNYYSPEPDTFRTEETLELIAETITVQDMASIWEINKVDQQPSVIYSLRAVMLDSELPLSEAGPVQSRQFDLATRGR